MVYFSGNYLEINPQISLSFLIQKKELDCRKSNYFQYPLKRTRSRNILYFLLTSQWCLFNGAWTSELTLTPYIRLVVTRGIEKETKDDDDGDGNTVDIVSPRFLTVINDHVHVSRFLVIWEYMNAYEVGRSNGRRVIGSYAADVIQFIIWRRKRGNISAEDNVGRALCLTANGEKFSSRIVHT